MANLNRHGTRSKTGNRTMCRCRGRPWRSRTLASASGTRGRRHVFGGHGLVSWSYGKQQLGKRIAARLGKPLEPWTLHDIRRSVVTHIAELGYAQPHLIEVIVNHISGSKGDVAGVYNRA